MSNETKKTKPFYKKWWVWVIAFFIIGAIGNANKSNETNIAEKAEKPPVAEASAAAPAQPAEKKQAPLFILTDVANKSEQEVGKILGEPNKKEDGKFRYVNTEAYLPAPNYFYKDGVVEVKYIEGKAARITVTPKEEIKFPEGLKQALQLVGLPADAELITSDRGSAFSSVNGIYKGQIFHENNKVSYLYFIVDEKYK